MEIGKNVVAGRPGGNLLQRPGCRESGKGNGRERVGMSGTGGSQCKMEMWGYLFKEQKKKVSAKVLKRKTFSFLLVSLCVCHDGFYSLCAITSHAFNPHSSSTG